MNNYFLDLVGPVGPNFSVLEAGFRPLLLGFFTGFFFGALPLELFLLGLVADGATVGLLFLKSSAGRFTCSIMIYVSGVLG